MKIFSRKFSAVEHKNYWIHKLLRASSAPEKNVNTVLIRILIPSFEIGPWSDYRATHYLNNKYICFMVYILFSVIPTKAVCRLYCSLTFFLPPFWSNKIVTDEHLDKTDEYSWNFFSCSFYFHTCEFMIKIRFAWCSKYFLKVPQNARSAIQRFPATVVFVYLNAIFKKTRQNAQERGKGEI